MAKTKKHIIDTDKIPSLPFSGAVIEEHQKMGKLTWDPKQITLWLHQKQKGGYIVGHDLRKAVPKPLNASVLDFLIEHPELWPEEWKKNKDDDTQSVYFWGTIFRLPTGGGLCVRYGCWRGGEVVSYYSWLGLDWSGDYPCASLASTQNLDTKNSSVPESLELPAQLIINDVVYVRQN